MEDATRGAALYRPRDGSEAELKRVENINAYLVAYGEIYIEAALKPLSLVQPMTNGNKPADGENLIFSAFHARMMTQQDSRAGKYIKPLIGAAEAIDGSRRYCLWIKSEEKEAASSIPAIADRVEQVREFRLNSKKELTKLGAETAYAFQQIRQSGSETVLIVPRVSSEVRPYLPAVLAPEGSIIGDRNFAIFNPFIVISR